MEQVNGHRADHTEAAIFQRQTAPQHHRRVNPAYRCKLQVALLGGAGDDKAHLVHVGREHDPLFRGALAFLKGDNRAHSVHRAGGAIGLDLL